MSSCLAGVTCRICFCADTLPGILGIFIASPVHAEGPCGARITDACPLTSAGYHPAPSGHTYAVLRKLIGLFALGAVGRSIDRQIALLTVTSI